ncbi:Hypothetical predicted protein [Paramuricea clavata]|uniref:Reverse transcriptase domain-containing protein n=1 Tax=Paramuricea clavata TaxID=317549 RepID=A0A6S7FR57_PARCT|nr:Hypothetical predicted protein [Paramuricea clavata]
MGINSSNISYIVMFGLPQSMLDLHQEAWRGGKCGLPTDVKICFYGQQVSYCDDGVRDFVNATGCLCVAAYSSFDAKTKTCFCPNKNLFLSQEDLPPVNSTDAVGLESITITVEEVCCLLSGLCTTKATGPDGISATLLRECATELAPSLTELFTMLLAHGKVPSEWKQANVVPVPKKDDPNFSKAFDSVSHPNLIQKLRDHGISGPLLKWFCDYLTSKKQHVVFNGVSPSFLEVTSGIPQCSVVGPLLFIIYVNETTHSKTPMFANNSQRYRQITLPDDEQLLQ